MLPFKQGFHHGCGLLLVLYMAMQLPRNRAPDSPVMPDRLYFKIGDVARICGLETYVLRFWESQFPSSNPTKAEPASGFTAAVMLSWS